MPRLASVNDRWAKAELAGIERREVNAEVGGKASQYDRVDTAHTQVACQSHRRFEQR